MDTPSASFSRMPPQVSFGGLSAFLGVITLLAFGTERLLYETAGIELGDAPVYVMGGVVVAVGIGAFSAFTHGHSVKTAILLSLGPVGGLTVYLIGYHLVLPPSSNSPTWLIFLVFTGVLLTLGVVIHLFGRLVKHIIGDRVI